LRKLQKAGERFDVVVIDPPSFARTRATVENAMRGYKELCLGGSRSPSREDTLPYTPAPFIFRGSIFYPSYWKPAKMLKSRCGWWVKAFRT
jgi:hypothetical protein